MITIPQDMTLRRLQQTGLLLNFLTEEQKIAVYNKFVADAKDELAEKSITTQIANLQTALTTLKAIQEDRIIPQEGQRV